VVTAQLFHKRPDPLRRVGLELGQLIRMLKQSDDALGSVSWPPFSIGRAKTSRSSSRDGKLTREIMFTMVALPATSKRKAV
jgi:hypothetical protein